MILPSKKLLSAVLEIGEIIDVRNANAQGKSIQVKTIAGWHEPINIYELMHLMKEWAFQEYDITIWTSRRQAKLNITGIWDEMPRFISDEDDSTDISCVTKACEWLFEQK